MFKQPTSDSHMTRRIILSLTILLAASPAFAQSLFDFDLPGLQISPRQSQSRKVELEYDTEFNYYFDLRDFSTSSDLMSTSEKINHLRLTPTVGLSIQQNRNIKHRVMLGIDVMKNLGANPFDASIIEKEGNDNLNNWAMFESMLAYYNLQYSGQNKLFEAYAGIFPRSASLGNYSRAIFSDKDYIYRPDIEGFLLKFESPKFITEAGFDTRSYKELERVENYSAFTYGEYKPLKWASIGWDGAYNMVRPSYLTNGNADNLVFNPFLKFDLAHLLKMQEFSVKAGGIMSYQIHRNGDKQDKFPMGFEIVSDFKKWGLGIENTFYFGDNLQPYKSSTYTSVYNVSDILKYIYTAEDFYFTRRGYAAPYDRLELYYQPEISSFFDIKASAVGHFIKPSGTVNAFVGWEAKISVLFNLDKCLNPRTKIFGQPAEKRTRNVSTNGIRL